MMSGFSSNPPVSLVFRSACLHRNHPTTPSLDTSASRAPRSKLVADRSWRTEREKTTALERELAFYQAQSATAMVRPVDELINKLLMHPSRRERCAWNPQACSRRESVPSGSGVECSFVAYYILMSSSPGLGRHLDRAAPAQDSTPARSLTGTRRRGRRRSCAARTCCWSRGSTRRRCGSYE